MNVHGHILRGAYKDARSFLRATFIGKLSMSGIRLWAETTLPPSVADKLGQPGRGRRAA